MPRISQLPALTAADNADEIAIVDVSASTTKKITRGDLLKSPLPTNSVTTAAVANGSITANKIDFTTLAFGNYSTTEVDTGFKYRDGKNIYKRTFTGTITASVNTRHIAVLVSGVSRLIDYTGFISDAATVPGSSVAIGSEWFGVSGAEFLKSSVLVDNTGALQLFSFSTSARTNAWYEITVLYTKV